MSLIRKALGMEPRDESRMSVDDYLLQVQEAMQFGGLWYSGKPLTTYGNTPAEDVGGDFEAMVNTAYRSNGVIFAIELVRILVFSAARFRWQRLLDGKQSNYFGTRDLELLERPWTGGTTQDLLVRTLLDADFAGNSFLTTDTPLARLGGDNQKEIVRFRPDWTYIALEPRMMRGGQVGHRLAGYGYCEGGIASGNDVVAFEPGEVAHFAPTPDPLATFRGMSWLTPVVREIQNDKLMGVHQRKFFENAATPNMVIKHAGDAGEEAVRRWIEDMEARHTGATNAYKNLNLYPGADATVVGADFKQLDFKSVQGAGETRLAAAGGVPPVIVGLSEGIAAATYSNYSQARRRLGDGTIHPLWQNVAGSLEPLLPSQGPGTRLWYDASEVPFLREDEKDAAEIAQVQAQTIRSLIDAGYEPESVIKAVEASDWRLLRHSGLYSVQLQPAGAQQTPNQGDTDGS